MWFLMSAPFLRLKSTFCCQNFSQTKILTAKPMVVGYVQHYSRHFVKILGQLLESFFRKVQKTAKNDDFSKISNF